MANLIDVIIDNFPPVSGISIPLGSTITLSFNVPMDEAGLSETLFLEGPDTDQYIGQGLTELVDPSNISQGELDDFLKSPGYKGIAQWTFSFESIT